MRCKYCNGDLDTGGECVSRCWWSQNKHSVDAPTGWICPVCGSGLSPFGYPRFDDSDIAALLLDEIERLQAEHRWIPVSERLPEKEIYVITYTEDDDVRGDMICFNGSWLSGLPVTHWMPLPPPPEDNYVGDSDHEHDDRIL